MKKNHFTSLLCLLLGLCQISTAQSLTWASQFGGSLTDKPTAMATDATGNIYITGSFEGTTDFDPSSGIYNLTSNGSYDIFVAKFNANGNLVWAHSFGSTNWDEGKAIGISPLGYVYVAGRFTDTTDFNPGAGIANLFAQQTTCGLYGVDAFVLKLDANGNYQWAYNFGGSSADEIHALAVGSDESVHLAGYYRTGSSTETVDFNPGTGTFLLSSPIHWAAEFIVKLNGNGNFVWAKQFTSSSMMALNCLRNTMVTINALAIDANGRVHAAGKFSGNVDFDPSSAVYTLSTTVSNGFVVKLQANGNFVWAKTFTGGNNEILDIAVDANSRVYVTGGWSGTVDFNPTTTTTNLTSKNSNYDAFVVKLTAAGGYTWAKALAGNQTDVGRAIEVDAAGNVYTAGQFYATTDFNPASGSYKLTSAGDADVYLSKLSASGKFVWAKAVGGTAREDCIGLNIVGSAVHVTGNFAGTADFDPSTTTYNLTAAGGNDGFIVTLDQNIASKTELEPTKANIAAYPNPTSCYITLQLPAEMQHASFTIFDLNGRALLHGNTEATVHELDLSTLPTGTYLLTLTCEGMEPQNLRIVKTH